MTGYRGRIARSLVSVRESADVSQRELAERLGHDKRTVQKWESGEMKISLEDFLEIFDALHVAVEPYSKWIRFLRADCLLCTSSCATIPSEISNEMLVYLKNTRFSFFCQFNGVFRRIFSGKDFLAWVLLDDRPVVLGMQASFLPFDHSSIFQKVGDPPCSFTAA